MYKFHYTETTFLFQKLKNIGNSSFFNLFGVKMSKIAIIGSGPCGLVNVKILSTSRV